MICEFDAEAGYPAASLKERIYCKTEEEPMAGILIYVAVSDEEGSLGGLMELAKPERFLRLLTGNGIRFGVAVAGFPLAFMSR